MEPYITEDDVERMMPLAEIQRLLLSTYDALPTLPRHRVEALRDSLATAASEIREYLIGRDFFSTLADPDAIPTPRHDRWCWRCRADLHYHEYRAWGCGHVCLRERTTYHADLHVTWSEEPIKLPLPDTLREHHAVMMRIFAAAHQLPGTPVGRVEIPDDVYAVGYRGHVWDAELLRALIERTKPTSVRVSISALGAAPILVLTGKRWEAALAPLRDTLYDWVWEVEP